MHNRLGRAVLTVVTCTTGLAPAMLGAEMSDAERSLTEHVDAGVDDAIALLERLVNINSGTQNLAGVREVGDALAPELEALGLRTRWIPGDGFGRAGHLVAEKDGTGPRILLIGHLDTVFERDSPFQKFERIDEWTAKGPGIIDMKGGDVILLLALEALKAAGLLGEANLAVIFTGDEEKTGDPLSEARAELIALAGAARFAIGFEDGDGDPTTAVISRRGSTSWKLRTTGVRAHSSLIFTDEVGSGAIYEIARILRGFHAIREPHLTMSPGVILGGTEVSYADAASRGEAFGKSNVTPQVAIVKGGLRAFSMEQRELVKKRMQTVVAKNLPQTSAELAFRDSYPPMAPSDGNRRLLEILDNLSTEAGLGSVGHASLGRLGAADVSFAAPHVEAAIDGLGLGGRDGHTVRETADLRILPVQAKRAAVLIHRLTRGAFDQK